IVVQVRLRRFGRSAYRRFAPTAGPGVPLATVAAITLAGGETCAYAGAVGTDARPEALDDKGRAGAPLRDDAFARADYRAALVAAMYSDVAAELDSCRD
ncbi:MAG: hypothetical protein WBB07_23065, partial [Mycobacterium sp.]